MKKILLTSSSFPGEVQLLYNDEKKLILIDFREATLNDEQIKALKALTPFEFDKQNFRASFRSDTLIVTEEDFVITFDMFFDKYAERINKDRCLKVWNRMNNADRTLAYTKLYLYERHLKILTWKSKANPETYLKSKFWLNDWK